MSRRISWVAILMMALMVLFTVSCEGPAGEDGLAGVAGADGADGADGIDANSTCVECHSQANWDEVEGLYALSGHSLAGALGYAGGRSGCSQCHSAEGFSDYLAGYASVNLTEKSALSCESCHGNHASLEGDIGAPLATDAPVALILDATNIIDMDGASNLCISCHNSRRGYEYYEVIDSVWTSDVNGNDSLDFVVPDGSIYISSSHAGPHYSAQVNTLYGLGGYGTSSVSIHESVGCVSCHMGTATTTEGGHSFIANLENCTEACHGSVTDIAAYATEKHDAIKARMDAILAELVSRGVMAESYGSYGPAVGVVTEAEFKAFWNYRVMYSDHSYGVHNPGYFNTMLTQAEASLGL